MKRFTMWLATLALGVLLGRWPQRETVTVPATTPPVSTKPTLAEMPSADASARTLPQVAAALAMPPGAGQTEALLHALLNLVPADLPSALSLLLPTGHRELVSHVAEQWARQDAAAAREFANSPQGRIWLRSEQGRALETGLMKGFVHSHEASAMELARAAENPHTMLNLFSALMAKDPTHALEWAAQQPSLQNHLAAVVMDPAAAEQILQLPPGPARKQLLTGAFNSLLSASFDDPSQLPVAVDWWQKLDPAEQILTLTNAFDDPSPQTTPWNKRFAEKLNTSDLERLKSALVNDPQLRGNTAASTSVARLLALSDSTAAYEWANTTLTGEARTAALGKIIGARVPTKITELGPFLDTIPPGPLRDQAAQAAMERAEFFSPAELARWAERRSDPGERKTMLAPALSRWASESPTAAANFLTSDIPPQRRQGLTAKVMMQLTSPLDQVRLAQQLPPDLAMNALHRAWELAPPDYRSLMTAAQQASGTFRGEILAVAKERLQREQAAAAERD